MKFSNAELCNSIKAIVAETILPNLATPESKMAALAISTAMDELIKREASTPTLLVDILSEGNAIAAYIVELLAELGLDESKQAQQCFEMLQTDVDGGIEALAQRYNALLQIMEAGCHRLHQASLHSTQRNAEIGSVIDRAGNWDLAYVLRQSTPLLTDPAKIAESGPLTAEKLQSYLTATLAERKNLKVADFQRVPGGMSKQTYFFTLSDSSGSEPLVVRKANDAQLLDLGCLNIKREFYLLKDVYASGFACPEPLWFADQPADTDGSYFIMRKSKGRILGSFFGADTALSEDLLMHLAETFGRLHSIPMEHFAANIERYSEARYIGSTIEQALRYNLDAFYEFWKTLERLPSPFEVRALHWLRENVPRNPHPVVLTHNDLMIHNFLADGDRITSVLDWEGAAFGDPASDLGYVKTEISKHIDWSRFLAHYRAHGGQPIDESAFAYHETLTNLRNLVGTNKHTTTIKTGRGDPKDILLTYNYVPVFMNIIDKNIAGAR